MKLLRLTVHRFTAFEDATFELGQWVNVFIRENGTGKSHVLKLLYALSESVRRFAQGDTLDVTGSQGGTLDAIVAEMLFGVFRPDTLGRLVRRGQGRRSARIVLDVDGGSLEVKLTSLGKVTARLVGDFSALGRSIFLPPREVLTLLPGRPAPGAAARSHRRAASRAPSRDASATGRAGDRAESARMSGYGSPEPSGGGS